MRRFAAPNRPVVLLAAIALAPVPVAAEDLRDFCPDRPGLGTPTCIVDRGHIVVEAGVADWTHDTDASATADTVLLGEVLVRYGLTGTLEVQIGWDGYGIARTRDRRAGVLERSDGGGDMTLAVRQSLRNPDGSGFSLALMPYVTAPTGSGAFSAGNWGTGLIVPVSWDLGGGVSLALTPEVDAAVDGDGDGRHLAYSSVIGLGVSLSDSVSMALEASVARDDDPDGSTTTALAGLAFAWQPQDDLQLDAGIVAGLNSASPDVELYAGVARRF